MNIKAITLASAILAASSNASALNIALTNDDGWDAAGIQSLQAALIAAGHTVTLAGSSENQSGSSAAIDLGNGNLLVTKELEQAGGDQYSVALGAGGGAEPATAGQIAISIAKAYGPVDLLVSGTNAGANIGAFTGVSGTVGAAIHGIAWISGERVPSIAISTDEPQPSYYCGAVPGEPTEEEAAACEAANAAHFDVVSAWFVNFLAELEQQPGGLKDSEGLLPAGVGLNINYPVSDQIAGVTSNVQGLLTSISGYPLGLPIGCYGDCAGMPEGDSEIGGIVGQPFLPAEEVNGADTTSFTAGYVTIVPIAADLTAPANQRAKFNALVEALND